MNQFKRYISQVLIWFSIWTILFMVSGSQIQFIEANIVAFMLQILLLYVFIYYTVPLFLFKKKQLYFVFISISTILLCTLISVKFGHQPPTDRLPIHQINKGPSGIPSRFFIHLLVLSISCVISILIEIFIFAQNKEKSIVLAKAELMESELKFLKMQINPHFLFNALNNIYTLSVINSNKTQESISTLSEMLRYVIYDCEQPKVPIQKELDYVYNYIELFKLKSSKPFNITFTKNIADENIMVAPMIFLPYIENAFKHSGIEKGKDHFIAISLVQKNQNINFLIENSIPTNPISTDKQGGIGLQNVQKRLEILYPEKHQLEILKTNTFKVNLNLTT